MIVVTPSTLLAQNTDKVGHFLIAVKNALVASSLWRVIGSGDGASAFSLRTQTSAPYDVFTGNSGLGYQTNNTYPGAANTISRSGAWMVLEEIASGRCLAFQRGSTGFDYLCGRISLGGVATSGATATAVPAAVGTNAALYSAVNGGGSNFWKNSAGPWTGAGNAIYLHIGVSESARGSNICPFFAFAIDTTGDHLTALIYESLLQPLTGELPLAIAATRIGEALGVNGFTGSFWIGGSTLYGLRPCGFVTPAGTVPPTSISADPDGVYRTKTIEFRRNSNSNWLGISENFVVNPGDFAGRPYPHTYFRDDPLPSPKLSISGALVPWASGAVVVSPSGVGLDHTDLEYAVVSSDTAPPTVTNIDPPSGTEISRDQPISFRVIDETRLAYSAVFIQYPSIGRYDVAWDGLQASDAYNVSRSSVVGGYDYVVSCKGGWPATPHPVVRAIDGGGTLDEDL